MHRSLSQKVWTAAGMISVALGVIGIALPLLPTVPFMILAAFCFARGNPVLEAKLLAHPRLGPPIRAWRERGAIGRAGKLGATGAFAVSIGLGFAFLGYPQSLIPLGVAVVTLSWIWTRPG
jgi:uncharacterized protein